MDNIGWDIPLTGGGREDGLNDSGISYFQDNPIKSFTREVIQDTLDARFSKDKPAQIEFLQRELEKGSIPGIYELTEIFRVATNSFEGKKNDTYNFFKKGYEALQKNTISVLAIRDRNTTGLTRVEEKEDSHFHRLTKTSGDTGKTGTSNGSYGIGKHAPFAASVFRTMLYGTLNRDVNKTNRGFQGVIKIASFNKGEDYLTQGTGFYGEKEGFKPMTDLTNLNNFFKRIDGDFGTDKFILGFEAKKDWKHIVVEESVSNYMWAIINGSLEIVVDDIIINKKTLSEVVEIINNNNPKSSCLEFYMSLISKDSIKLSNEFYTEEGKLEKMKLFLLKDDNFKSKISLVRGTGMKIYEKGHFRTPINFAGTLIVDGDGLNRVLRKMEPPTHDDWKPGLYKDNQKYAEKLKRDLYKWLRDEVNNITPKFEKESFELTGMQNILPSLGQEESPSQEIDRTSVNEKLESLVVVNNSMVKTTPKPRNKPDKPKDLTGKRIGTPKNQNSKAQINNMRAFCIDQEKGLYRLVINSKTTGEAHVEIKLIGESISESAEIFNVIDNTSGKEIDINGNVIGPIKLLKKKTLILTISMSNVTRYSLEVASK